jgi:hypothetical protein
MELGGPPAVLAFVLIITLLRGIALWTCKPKPEVER